MSDLPVLTPRFVRRTALAEGEYNRNFEMLDRDVLAVVSSAEADAITPLMSKIYLRLRQAPDSCRESTGVLRFTGEESEGKWIRAWTQLCRHLRVSSETASKALSWLHQQGIIGYSAFKNGVGIRIFLNRAASSIAHKPHAERQKFLPADSASLSVRHASPGETAFKDTYGVLDRSDIEIKSPARRSSAIMPPLMIKSFRENTTSARGITTAGSNPRREPMPTSVGFISGDERGACLDEIVNRLRCELEPCVKAAAMQAAQRASTVEHERTRQWFETKALPKAVRVAQSESYQLLRKQGALHERERSARAALEVGRGAVVMMPGGTARALTDAEIGEAAETCLALWEAQGKSIETTLKEIGVTGGGWVLPEDLLKVRDAARIMVNAAGVQA